MDSHNQTHSCDYYDLVNEIQKMNHLGADHMERGEYEAAIDIFIKALELWEQEKDNADEEMSSSSDHYYFYDIDDCILQQQQQQQQQQMSCSSSNTPLSPSTFDHNAADVTKGRRRESLIKQQQLSIESKLQQDNDINDEEQEGGFVYSLPVRTPPILLLEDDQHHHYLPIPANKSTFSLILILNVAMAHHLHAVLRDQQGQSTIANNRSRHLLEKALRLYELAHEILMDLNTCSPKATIIISNNVGEIHRVVNNKLKHQMCLRHLLSTMMYMVDNNQDYLQQQQQQPNQQQEPIMQNTKEWDGFLRNTSRLMLQQNCAGAA